MGFEFHFDGIEADAIADAQDRGWKKTPTWAVESSKRLKEDEDLARQRQEDIQAELMLDRVRLGKLEKRNKQCLSNP